MACAARQMNGKGWCQPCRLVFDAEANWPECMRGCNGRNRTGDPTLKPDEVRALKAAKAEWLNRQPQRGRRGGGWRGKSGARISKRVGEALLAFKLVTQSKYLSIRISHYGEAWLDRHAKGGA